MAGNHNSGRKTARVEKNKMQALEKAWKRINENVDKVDVKEIALPLALKDMAQKISNPDGSNLAPQPILVKFLDCERPEDNRNPDGV